MRFVRFIKAVFKYIWHGNKVSFEEYVSRLDKCCQCEDFHSNDNSDRCVCGICGCYITKKAKMSTEKCPNNKW